MLVIRNLFSQSSFLFACSALQVYVSILRGIVQVVEQRISNQAENLKNVWFTQKKFLFFHGQYHTSLDNNCF